MPMAFPPSCGMFAFPVSLAKSHGAGQMLPWPCVWREAEGRLRKAFSFHSHPPKRFSHLIDFIGFYFSPHSIHVWRRAGLYEARPGGPACCLVHVWSQQKSVKRSSGGFCLKHGCSQPDLFIAWLQKHLCQQKVEGVMGVEKGGWRWEQLGFSPLLAYSGKC